MNRHGVGETTRPPERSGDMSAAIMAAPVLVRQAIRKHQAGQLDSACELYERALEIDPVDPDALNLLGALHLQRGDLASAVRTPRARFCLIRALPALTTISA